MVLSIVIVNMIKCSAQSISRMGKISTVTVSGELAEFLEGKVTTVIMHQRQMSLPRHSPSCANMTRDWPPFAPLLRRGKRPASAAFRSEQFLREMHQKHGV